MSITPSTNKDTNSYGFENNVSIMDTSAYSIVLQMVRRIAPIVVQQKVFEGKYGSWCGKEMPHCHAHSTPVITFCCERANIIGAVNQFSSSFY
ncbi:hypothetical protein TNCV_2902371 [Trichonephila clavipes]|nr:hypothetical protein TNCV_2902371 [Trichonephila clavipes]